jgi:leucine dehydrogenase
VTLQMGDWNGEELHIHHDEPSGAWIAIAIHSTRGGLAIGGTRWRNYADLDEALFDVLRLSSGMTLKAAVAGMPCGGAKAVISGIGPLSGTERDGLLQRYGELVEQLGGRFVTGPDIGTAEADMDVIGRQTDHVFCRTVERGGSGSPSPWTALGVLAGIRVTLDHATGSDELAGRTMLVQGAGEVGRALAGLVHEAGARVLLTDIDMERATDVAVSLPGSETVDPADAMATRCDVFAPCAVGAVLNPTSIPQLHCSVVAGSANNQLLSDDDGMALRERDILYAPDFVINSGGLIRGVGAERLGWSDDVIRARIGAIGDTLRDIYRRADAEGITTHQAAMELARESAASE